MRTHKLLIGVVAAFLAAPSIAEVTVGGLVDVVAKNSETEDITNVTFKGFSNFNTLRTRVLVDAPVADHTTAFTQILINNNTFSVYAAYIRFDHVAGDYLHINAGMIPTTVGSFVGRAYSDKNPLIGQPLMYIHHSNYVPGRPDSIRTAAELLATRASRSIYGLPVIYDACWNTGAEFYGSIGKLDYSLGVLAGSVGYPNMEQRKNVPQFTTHLVWYFGPGHSFGASAFLGPYLFEGGFADKLPGYGSGSGGAGEERYHSYNEYLNSGVAAEYHLATRYLDFYAEAVFNSWEHPYLPDLSIMAGYLEAAYKFTPGWHVAGRFDAWEPNELSDGSGGKAAWDYPVRRYEFGIGYHPARRVLTKLVMQINRFDGTALFDNRIGAFQVSVGF